MVWSNNIPPNIITQPDGTTVFTGALSVQDANGNTNFSVTTDGTVNGKKGNFPTLTTTSPDGKTQYNVGQQLQNLPLGLIGQAALLQDSFTINNATQGLVMLSNPFTLNNTRNYEFKSSAIRGLITGATAGEEWIFSLILYSQYPNATNYTVGSSIATVLDSITFAWASNADIVIPALYALKTQPTAGSTYYLGFIFYRVSGTGSVHLHSNASDSGVLWVTAFDVGAFPNSIPLNSVYNPIPYAGGTPPPPPTKNYDQTFGTTWSQTYDQSGGSFFGGTAHMYQGDPDSAGGSGHGIVISACNFDYATIGANLSGSTNVSATLYFYCEHTYYNAGMTINVFSHNTPGGAPGTSGGITGAVNQFTVSGVTAPGWVAINIPVSLLAGFVNGTLTGFGLYTNSTDLQYYGYFGGNTETNPFQAPYMHIYWTK